MTISGRLLRTADIVDCFAESLPTFQEDRLWQIQRQGEDQMLNYLREQSHLSRRSKDYHAIQEQSELLEADLSLVQQELNRRLNLEYAKKSTGRPPLMFYGFYHTRLLRIIGDPELHPF